MHHRVRDLDAGLLARASRGCEAPLRGGSEGVVLRHEESLDVVPRGVKADAVDGAVTVRGRGDDY